MVTLLEMLVDFGYPKYIVILFVSQNIDTFANQSIIFWGNSSSAGES